jgi:hypothetical protein
MPAMRTSSRTPAPGPKSRCKALPVLCASLLLAGHGIVRAEQTIYDSLTVQQGLSILQDTSLYGATTSFGRLTDNPQMPVFQLGLSQDEWEYTQSNVIRPGYNSYQTIVVEDYGWMDTGYWQPNFDWVTVDEYYPPVYDTDGNVVSEGYSNSRQDWQQVGQTWIPTQVYGVTGTHTETQETWVPDEVENVTMTGYGAAHVKFNASRSDTNYDFNFPSSYGGGSMWKAMTIYSGGITMNSEDGWGSLALTPRSFSQWGYGANGAYATALATAEQTQHYSWQSSVLTPAGWVSAGSNSYLRADALQFSRTEYSAAGTTTAQTQIAARSAQFGGAVTVEGNLNVKGRLRVLPAGDLEMGAFHKGTRPDGTTDNGN